MRVALVAALSALVALGVAAPAGAHCRTRHHKRVCDRPAKKPVPPSRKPAKKPPKKPAKTPAKTPAKGPTTTPTNPTPGPADGPASDPSSPSPSDPGAGPAPGPSLPRRVGVDEKEYSVTPSYLKLAAGTIEVDVTNFGMDDHDLSIRQGAGAAIATVPVGAGKTEVFNVDLAAGTYTFYCSLTGHEQLGMKQTVTVE